MPIHRPKHSSRVDIEKLCAIRDFFIGLPNQVALFSAEDRQSSLLIALWACDCEGVDDPVTALSRIIHRHAISNLPL